MFPNHQPAILIRENDFRRMIIPNIWKNVKIKMFETTTQLQGGAP